MSDNQESIYDIDSYTDGELLTVLDLSNPTDRELEAKIIMMIRKYEGQDKKLARFFNRIYERFFEAEGDRAEGDGEAYGDRAYGDRSGGDGEAYGDRAYGEGDSEAEGYNAYGDRAYSEGDSEGDIDSEAEGFATMEKSGQEADIADDELQKNGWAKKWSAEKKQYYYINTRASPPKIQWTRPKTSLVNTDAAYDETDTAAQRTKKEIDKYVKNYNTNLKQGQTQLTPQVFNDTNTQTTRAIEYPSGWLNPLIKETFKRVLYLDSQYRNRTYYPSSSEYSINLSDTLLEVLTIKMHSVTIPYSWNTIINATGANQFVLRGIAPGINDGNHDITIVIPPGNYLSPTELVDTVNSDIKTELPGLYPDVSFNDTRIEYDPVKLVATLYVNITSSYTKSKLIFPSTQALSENIPAFLGFQSGEYQSTVIKSNPLYAINPLSSADIFNVYEFGQNRNAYFTIFNVIDASNTETITVQLNLPKSPFQFDTEDAPKQYTREAITNHLYRSLKNNDKLSDESNVELVTLNDGSQIYKLNIVLNRNTTTPGHQYIVFPDERTNFPIWTGPGSCFMFDREVEDPMHFVYSEEAPTEMQYVVYTQPYMLLTCITNTDYSYRINIPNSPEDGYNQTEYIDAINQAVVEQSAIFDISLNFILKHDEETGRLHMAIMIYKVLETGITLTELDYQIELYDEEGVYIDIDGYELSSWNYYLGFTNFAYLMNHPACNAVDSDYCEIYAENPMRDVEIAINDENNTFHIEQNNIYIPISVQPGIYTKKTLFKSINDSFAEIPETKNAYIGSTMKNGQLKTILKLAAKTTYSTKDYQLIFFDALSVGSCEKIDGRTLENTTWDQVLGWMLGFRDKYVYEMKPNSGTNTFKLTGTTAISVNSVNQAIIVLDDYTQNHLNDGLVTMTKTDKNIPLPSYTNRATNRCDPVTGKSVPSFKSTSDNSNLTQNQVYAAQQIAQNAQNKFQYYADPPSIKDMFSIIPMKLPSTHGDNIVVDGGTLQDNNRIYFGPVNIRRVNVKLLNERGRPIELNGKDWSFTVVCECLYTANKDEQGKIRKAVDKK